jgi:hypothetical protein
VAKTIPANKKWRNTTEVIVRAACEALSPYLQSKKNYISIAKGRQFNRKGEIENRYLSQDVFAEITKITCIIEDHAHTLHSKLMLQTRGKESE